MLDADMASTAAAIIFSSLMLRRLVWRWARRFHKQRWLQRRVDVNLLHGGIGVLRTIAIDHGLERELAACDGAEIAPTLVALRRGLRAARGVFGVRQKVRG